MREITQVQKYNLRGLKAVKKIQSIIKSGEAREIILEDEAGDAILRFVPDLGFINQTLKMLKGTMKEIKACTIVAVSKQTMLFN